MPVAVTASTALFLCHNIVPPKPRTLLLSALRSPLKIACRDRSKMKQPCEVVHSICWLLDSLKVVSKVHKQASFPPLIVSSPLLQLPAPSDSGLTKAWYKAAYRELEEEEEGQVSVGIVRVDILQVSLSWPVGCSQSLLP